MDAKALVLAAAMAATSFAALGDNQKEMKVVARAIPAVPGAIICPDYETVEMMIEWYRAHWEDNFEDAITNGQSRLRRGAPTSKPPLAQYGCSLAPAGIPMTLELGPPLPPVPVVRATLPDGRKVRGVTDPGLFAYPPK